MARKSIKLRDEAYRRLRAVRRRGETFNETLGRLLDLLDERQRKSKAR